MLDQLHDVLGPALNFWRPALEVLILTVVIYYTSRFLRGTRGWPVVIGFVVLLLAFSLVTALLKLEVLRWILGNASVFIAFGVLIIFQPELRRMFGELGNLPLFTTASEQRESIEVIIQTCERLSDVRIGALIAIEQSIHLQDAVEAGIKVDCDATPEMLETIFFPNNAIHDGGVIIKGDRIAYAACIFPLTRRTDLAKTLGTRHRAAIGLSEETDAIVVVVSEETGAISYAYKGQLVRGVTLEELRAFLSSLLVHQPKGPGFIGTLRKFIPDRSNPGPAVITRHEPRPVRSTPTNNMALRDITTRDLGWKIFSLLLAVGIWLTVKTVSQGSPGQQAANPLEDWELRTLSDLPVFVVSEAEDVRQFKVSPDHVEVTVRANPDVPIETLEKEVHVTVDLTDIESSRGLHKRVDVATPPGVTLVSVTPEDLYVVIPPQRINKQ